MKTLTRRSVVGTTVATAGLLLVAACGETPQASPDDASDRTTGDVAVGDSATDAGNTPPTPAGAVAGSSDADLDVSCGSVRFDGLPADPSSFPPLGDVEADIDLSSIAGEQDFFEIYDWFIADQADDELVLFGASKEQPVEGPRYADAAFTRDGDRWVPAGWGQCRIEVHAEGWGNARFVLDPDVRPEPTSSTVVVQAWEMACASGQAPDGREVRSVVVSEDAESVSILVLVEPVQGGADCQGNPSFPLEVELGEPLGDRTVLDASVDPALRRPWPPTDSSLSSQGIEE